MKTIKIAKMNAEEVAKQIGNFIIKEILEEGRTGAVIGLSGGVDSTTTAALTKKAFEAYNSKNPDNRLELVAYLLPSKMNDKKDEEDGKKVADRLGIRCELINIQPLIEAYEKVDSASICSQFNRGNRISELRAAILHGKAAFENKILLGTGNKDEDFGVGYYTLFGDGAVRISPIGMLPKRLVREMARYLGFEDLADRTSTPGLEPGQTAFKDLGYKYEIVVELFCNGLEQGFKPEDLIKHPQLIKEAEKNIEEYQKLYGFKKFFKAEELLEDIAKRNKIAKMKTRIISPPVAKIKLEYLERI